MTGADCLRLAGKHADRAMTFCAGFFRNKADESMTRAVTLLLAFGALLLCVAVYRVATRPSLHDAAGVIAAICSCLAPVIAGGVVALSKRTRVNAITDPIQLPPPDPKS